MLTRPSPRSETGAKRAAERSLSLRSRRRQIDAHARDATPQESADHRLRIRCNLHLVSATRHVTELLEHERADRSGEVGGVGERYLDADFLQLVDGGACVDVPRIFDALDFQDA